MMQENNFKLHLNTTALEKTFSDGASAFKLGPIDLDLEGGTCLAVSGPNGSGKSTLFQIMTGNMAPSSGTVTLSGYPIAESRKSCGYLPQHNLLPMWATPDELCRYSAGMLAPGERAHNAAGNALAYWDCQDFAQRPIGMLSTGMRKRVGLAIATLHDPDVLILDEPFEALDLGHIAALRQEIQRRKAAGGITIFATHIASFAAELANSSFFLHNGHGSTISWPESKTTREEILERKFAEVAPPPSAFLHSRNARNSRQVTK